MYASDDFIMTDEINNITKCRVLKDPKIYNYIKENKETIAAFLSKELSKNVEIIIGKTEKGGCDGCTLGQQCDECITVIATTSVSE